MKDFIRALFVSFFSVLLLVLLAILGYALKKRMFGPKVSLAVDNNNRAYLDLNLDEQELYFQSQEFLSANTHITGDLSSSQRQRIQEKGVRAWEFVKDSMLTNNDLLIVQKTELNFFKGFECSTQTNLPLPQTNEVYYFECKIYSLPRPNVTIISIGLSIKPYPWFRLPGRHAHSVSYDSDGYRRHNDPFPMLGDPPFPKLMEGDVIGVGYRVRSGTVFFTRNGCKLSELSLGGHVRHFKFEDFGQVFPSVGANNLCSVHVNFGQSGFVFIEGNVKKWGFAPLEGDEPSPPTYRKFNGDVLLERSMIDEELSPGDTIHDFPPDFLDLNVLNAGTHILNEENTRCEGDQITLRSLIPLLPPKYEHTLNSL